MRMVLASISTGPPPSRACSTASRAVLHTSSDIVAVDDCACDAVGACAVRQVAQRHLAAHRRRVGPLIIFETSTSGAFCTAARFKPS